MQVLIPKSLGDMKKNGGAVSGDICLANTLGSSGTVSVIGTNLGNCYFSGVNLGQGSTASSGKDYAFSAAQALAAYNNASYDKDGSTAGIISVSGTIQDPSKFKVNNLNHMYDLPEEM